MAGGTLVIADYPVGYASGFGETLYNLFDGFPSDKLWTAHPSDVVAVNGKTRAQSINLPSPSRPAWLPHRASLAYYPLLKAQQFRAGRETVRRLSRVVEKNSIRNILAIPVSPWILYAALALHKQHSDLNLVVYVMDDWQGHHECHQLPYSRRRRRLLAEVIERANVRFAVSREMAAHYEDTTGRSWLVAHNGVAHNSLANSSVAATKPRQVLLAGDVNVFRFDAVIAFARAIERYNQRILSSKNKSVSDENKSGRRATPPFCTGGGVTPFLTCSSSPSPRLGGDVIEFTVMGEVAEQHRSALSALRAVKLLSRRAHAECLQAMNAADLLYLPLAFSQRSARISLYSLPTKLPEYLASGKSVFFHAPKESAVFKVAERYDLTPRLATVDAQKLDEFVASWAQTNGHGNGSVAKAQRALMEEFDLPRLAARFQAAFV